MTPRRILVADVWRMAISTSEVAILIECNQLFVQILSQTFLVMTLSARRYRHVRFQTSKCCGFGDVDMARRALRNVLLLLAAAVVYELARDPHRLCARKRRGEFVTTIAVVGNRLLRLPVTVETRGVFGWHSFERRRALAVTDATVVIVLRARMSEAQ